MVIGEQEGRGGGIGGGKKKKGKKEKKMKNSYIFWRFKFVSGILHVHVFCR